VSSSLDKQLAQFLRRTRGDQTFADFSRKLGLPPSTLHRLESCEQSITLGRLHQIMSRLKCEVADIFPGRAKVSRR
jgi:DNA-binding Xre family transcriptional regulator